MKKCLGITFNDKVGVTRNPEAVFLDVQYGMITPECEVAYKEWISKNGFNKLVEKAFEDELYSELVMLGYEEGSESAKMENDW